MLDADFRLLSEWGYLDQLFRQSMLRNMTATAMICSARIEEILKELDTRFMGMDEKCP